MFNRLKTKLLGDDESSIRLIIRLFREGFSRDYRTTFIFGVSCMVVVAFSAAAFAWIMRTVVNELFVSQRIDLLLPISLAVMAISTTRGLAIYGQNVATARIGNAITARYQARLIDKLVSLPLGFYSKKHSSQFVLRITRNAAAIQQAIMLISKGLARDLLTVIVLAAVMFLQNPMLSLIAFGLGPIVVLGVFYLLKQMRDLDTGEFGALSAVVASTQETLQGLATVKSFGLEDEMSRRVKDAANGAERRANAINRIMSLTSPLTEGVGGLAIGLVILYAGWQSITYGRTPGEFMAFLTAFLLAYEPAKRLANLNVQLERCLNRVRHVYEVLDEPEVEQLAAPSQASPVTDGAVVLRDVSFGYRERQKVLRGISIEAHPGQVVALVGASGAGKSTIFSLIQRLYDPWEGEILIDGKNTKDLSLNEVRSSLSVVSQETFLFSGTVLENIALGTSDATTEQVHEAARVADAYPFIEDLKDGFDTEIEENGRSFSGGQRQRLAIARAVLKDAPILLLDEATSALDGESERGVRDALQRLMVDRTTIVIAHRLSTVMSADLIYVVEKGKIVGSGTHSELSKSNKRYNELFPDNAVMKSA